jgi:hypothetical protein
MIGISHCEAGILLADEWALPSMVRELVCLHAVAQSGPFALPRLASAACSMADRLGFSIGECKDPWDPAWLREKLPREAWPRLAPKIDALLESVPLKINSFECEFLPG